MPGKHVRFNEENILYSPAPSDSTPSPTISESSLPSSTGPNTPPQLFMRLGPVNIHPLLAYHSYVSPINYNVSYPPNTASANIRASPVNLAAYSTWDDLQLCSPATSSQGNPSLGPTMMHPTLNSMQLMSAALGIADVLRGSPYAVTAHLRAIHDEKNHSAFQWLSLEITARSGDITALDGVGECADFDIIYTSDHIDSVESTIQFLYTSAIYDNTRHCQPAHKPEACQITLHITGKVTPRSVCSPHVHLLADARSVK